MNKIKVDRDKFKDSGGRYITQSLFLEYAYNTDMAVYTLDDFDKEYKGVTYPSLKKRFIESEDVHEYEFAKANLYNWSHWQKMLANKWCRKHIEEWREELEVAIASRGVQSILDLAQDGNFQAAKYAADRQWNKRRGRPSKEELAKNARIEERIDEEFAEDAERVSNVIGIK